jgi:gliding motility-associated-like protein
MRFRFYILLIINLFAFSEAGAQDKSNRGKEFWLGYGYGWIFDNENPQNSQELVLYLSADAPATVTVSVTNTTWSQTVNIPANTVNASITIPKTGANDARIFNEGLFNKAVHIASDTPIVVYAHIFNTMTSAATMLMPVETYGYKYFSLNYSQSQSGSSPPNPPINTTQNGPSWYSWFYVVATEDNTRIEITPSDTTRNGWLPTQTYTVNLNKGEIYNVMGKLGGGNRDWEASKDMSGSKVVSVPGADGNCHPVALFSGSGGIRLCYFDGGEVMQQQIFPTQAWGTRYLTYHTLNNTNTDINDPFKNFYRIAVTDPATVVRRNGTVLTGLIKNFYYEILDSTGGDYIEADKPIMMAQYTPGGNRCYLTSQFAYGDPEMFYLSPLEQGKKDVLFYATRNSFIDYNYLNLIVSNAGLSSLRLDGNPFAPVNTKPHPNHPGYSVAVARITGAAAQHRLTCDSIFTGTMYGLGFFESYGYNIGTFINNLNSYIQIKNTLNTNGRVDTFTCPKTPVRLFAKLAYQANSIHWKLSQVPGMSPNADSIISNPVPVATEIINGRTYYVYTLQQDFTFSNPGTYKIPVSYAAAIIENCNQTENAELNVLVKAGPPADFTISNQLCLADTVRFTGTTTTAGGLFNYTSYLWNFDDATTQNTVNAKKRFATTGNHDIRYRVYADNGCIGDTTKTINIINGTGPQLSLTVTGNRCKDSLLTFTSSVTPAASNPTTWYWDFGGGQSSTSNTSNIATHRFTAVSSNITVRHSATLTTGCNPDTIIYLIPVINNNPSASFTITADTPCAKKPVTFNSSATGVSRWKWDFGNGAGTNAPPFIRTYNNGGNYTVSLVIIDTNGCGSASVNNTITINPSPPINAGPDKVISLGTPVMLDASIANPGNYSFSWTPSLYLNSATVLNPTSLPDALITYTVTATDKITFCEAKDSVVVNPVSKLYIPTAFTPNNDGRNDAWRIPGMALYPDGVVSVYNRWGQKIFETKNYVNNPWKGSYGGEVQPNGVYVYIIQLAADKSQVIKGTVTLIR